MLTPAETLELVRAGYTKDEIQAMYSDPAEDPAGDPAGQPAGDPPGDPAGDPAGDHDEPAGNTALDSRIKGIEDRLNHIITKMNYEAVKHSKQPDQPTETADDILASLIRGNKKEE